MKTITYSLKICKPDSKSEYLLELEASQPFMPISVGDTLNHGSLQNGNNLRVSSIEHLLTENANRILHMVFVGTEQLS